MTRRAPTTTTRSRWTAPGWRSCGTRCRPIWPTGAWAAATCWRNQARLENCYVNDLVLTFRRAGQAARADGSDTYSVTVTLQTTGARTLAALEQYGFDLDSLLTQAQAQLKERQ